MNRFPLVRLGILVARQLSAPIAAKIKALAVNNPRFRRTVVMGTGRFFHAYQLRLRLWSLALPQPRALPPISDRAALDSGASILGEAVVFGVGGFLIIFEVSRQGYKQDSKVLEETSQWLALLTALEELQRELVMQQQDIDRLHATLRRLAPHYYPRTQQDSLSSSDRPVLASSPTSIPPPVPETTSELDVECPSPTTSEYPSSSSSKSFPSDCTPPLTTFDSIPSPNSDFPSRPTSECPPPPTT